MPATLASCPGRDTEISFFEQKKPPFGGQYSVAGTVVSSLIPAVLPVFEE